MLNMNQTFKALADPTRRKILNLLKDRDMTAGEISDQFQMSKPSISQHLKILKQAELIQDEKKRPIHHLLAEHHNISRNHRLGFQFY